MISTAVQVAARWLELAIRARAACAVFTSAAITGQALPSTACAFCIAGCCVSIVGLVSAGGARFTAVSSRACCFISIPCLPCVT